MSLTLETSYKDVWVNCVFRKLNKQKIRQVFVDITAKMAIQLQRKDLKSKKVSRFCFSAIEMFAEKRCNILERENFE